MRWSKRNKVVEQEESAVEKKTDSKRKLNKWFNFGVWIDEDGLKANYRSFAGLVGAIKAMVANFGHSNINESGSLDFDHLIQQLGWDENVITERKRILLASSWLYFVLAVAVLGYVIYLWSSGNWLLGVMSFSFVLFLIAMACRNRMFYYQLYHRVVGCNLRQWLKELF